jgi:hypothetical protein
MYQSTSHQLDSIISITTLVILETLSLVLFCLSIHNVSDFLGNSTTGVGIISCLPVTIFVIVSGHKSAIVFFGSEIFTSSIVPLTYFSIFQNLLVRSPISHSTLLGFCLNRSQLLINSICFVGDIFLLNTRISVPTSVLGKVLFGSLYASTRDHLCAIEFFASYLHLSIKLLGTITTIVHESFNLSNHLIIK